MTVRVFVDGGWIGVESQIDETRQITSLTVGEALLLARDLIGAAAGDALAVLGRPIVDLLADTAELLPGDALPAVANGTDFDRVG